MIGYLQQLLYNIPKLAFGLICEQQNFVFLSWSLPFYRIMMILLWARIGM
jgi:hypothetical protein